MPDVACVVHDAAVGTENAAVGDVGQAHLVPEGAVLIQALYVSLCAAVVLEVSHDHVGVTAAQVVDYYYSQIYNEIEDSFQIIQILNKYK